jgi:hypothetical protein
MCCCETMLYSYSIVIFCDELIKKIKHSFSFRNYSYGKHCMLIRIFTLKFVPLIVSQEFKRFHRQTSVNLDNNYKNVTLFAFFVY